MRRVGLLALIWGWSFLFIKVAVDGMTPSTVATARMALGAVAIHAVVRLRRTRLPRDLRLWRHFVVMGVVYSALPFTLLAWGEQHITSALTAVLNASTSLFSALFAASFLGERLRRVQAGGLLLGFAGVAAASGVGGADLTGSSVGGAVAAVVASASYGVGFTYARRHLAGVDPLMAAAGQLTTGTALLLPVALVTTARQGIELAPHRLVAIALLGFVGTGVAYVMGYRSIAELGPTRASVVTQLVPVVAVAVGVLFLDEAFHLRLLAGGALTVLGIAILNDRMGGSRRRTAATVGA